MGETEKLVFNEYFILNNKSLNEIKNKDIELLKIELSNFENEILKYLKITSETKPNFEIHLKEILDKIYLSEKYSEKIHNIQIKNIYLDTYDLFEKRLRKTYGELYSNSFKTVFKRIFKEPISKNSSITVPEWSNENNFKTEAYYNKQKLNKIFSNYEAYSFFLELKKLLCDNEIKYKLVEYSFIYRKMYEKKLINNAITESVFRYDFLEKYFDEMDLEKLKLLSNSNSKYRQIIYDLVWDKFKPKWYNNKPA